MAHTGKFSPTPLHKVEPPAKGYNAAMSIPDNGAAKRRLPIGIQTFREVRGEGYYYVDKTAHIQRMADGGKHYFLSRPRRFGKSLLLDTIKELFEGGVEFSREDRNIAAFEVAQAA